MGPLHGLKIIELAGIGPGPFCGMMLADMGADVIRVDRPGGNPGGSLGHTVLFRNRRTVAVNLKSKEGAEVVLRLCEKADAIFEGFRPGVTERLGVGPDVCLKRNPKLVYGRMTGWGQDGPLAQAAGHDMNYISLSGALHAIGRKGEKPAIPLNLVGDFGGGGMFLAFGMVCALLEAQRSGKGQVVDASMVEGSAVLMAMFNAFTPGGYSGERGTHMLDGSAHFYDVYETKDGKYVSIGSIEPQFYELLLQKAELPRDLFGNQLAASQNPAAKQKMNEVFKSKTRDEWCALMEGTDVCFAPVLNLKEAPSHPHNVARKSYVEVAGLVQPAPAPKFSRTQPDAPKPMTSVGKDTDSVLSEFGFSASEIAALKQAQAVTQI